jgi:hypothetical protein
VVLAKLTGIEPHEVMEVLAAQQRWPRPAVDDVGVRILTIWGRTPTGRALMIALRHREGTDWWIAGARDLTPDERMQLEEWEARHE